jgi:hypothetical protein
MAEEDKRDDRTGHEKGAASPSTEEQTGDPGRTPGTAEGDEQTIEEDLRDKGIEG